MIRGRRYSVLGFSTDGSTNPDLLTNSDNYFNTTWNDRSIIPPASSQGVLPLPPGALASAHDQINEISPYNQYIPSFAYSEPSVSDEFYFATLPLTTSPESTISAQHCAHIRYPTRF